jgi:hypothetical protein
MAKAEGGKPDVGMADKKHKNNNDKVGASAGEDNVAHADVGDAPPAPPGKVRRKGGAGARRSWVRGGLETGAGASLGTIVAFVDDAALVALLRQQRARLFGGPPRGPLFAVPLEGQPSEVSTKDASHLELTRLDHPPAGVLEAAEIWLPQNSEVRILIWLDPAIRAAISRALTAASAGTGATVLIDADGKARVVSRGA